MRGDIAIGLVSDIHHGPDFQTKKGTAALDLLQQTLLAMRAESARMVVDLGDRITDADQDNDRRRMNEVARVFREQGLESAHLLGNHDSDYLSPADNEIILGVPAHSRTVSCNGWRLIFWQARTSHFWPDGCMLPDEDIEWLREELARSEEPAVVFSHVPLGEAAMHGNYYFEHNARYATYDLAVEARAVIENSGRVAACVAGHVHQAGVSRINGVVYLTVPSLTETSATHPEPVGGWAMLRLGADSLRFEVRGLVEETHEMALVLGRYQRMEPLPPYDPAMRGLTPKGSAGAQALAGVRGILFDLDGVLYRGEEPVPGAREFLEFLSTADIPFAALSNNAQFGPEIFADKLARMGMAFPAERIVTSAMAAASYLATHCAGCSVYVAGSSYLHMALQDAGMRCADVCAERVDVVAAGMSMGMTMEQLAAAVRMLRKGARLVATNADAALPVAGGFQPECGAVVAFLETAGGCAAHVVGKPNPDFFRLGLARLGCTAEETLMIGDTLETDILGACRAGLRSALVATGNPTDAAPNGGADIIPTVSVADLGALQHLLEKSRDV